MKRANAAFLIVLFFNTGICTAQTRRENEPFCGATGVKRVEVAPDDLNILGFTVGRSKFRDIQTKLGPAKTKRVSREEESDVSMCYVSPSDGTVLVFYTGVMGGGEDLTSFIIWDRGTGFPHPSECSPSLYASRTLTTARGLRLGLTRSELHKIAGAPTQTTPALDKYDFVCWRRMTQEEMQGFRTSNGWDVTSDPYFDRSSWIQAWYSDSRVSRIQIGEIESY